MSATGAGSSSRSSGSSGPSAGSGDGFLTNVVELFNQVIAFSKSYRTRVLGKSSSKKSPDDSAAPPQNSKDIVQAYVRSIQEYRKINEAQVLDEKHQARSGEKTEAQGAKLFKNEFTQRATEKAQFAKMEKERARLRELSDAEKAKSDIDLHEIILEEFEQMSTLPNLGGVSPLPSNFQESSDYESFLDNVKAGSNYLAIKYSSSVYPYPHSKMAKTAFARYVVDGLCQIAGDLVSEEHFQVLNIVPGSTEIILLIIALPLVGVAVTATSPLVVPWLITSHLLRVFETTRPMENRPRLLQLERVHINDDIPPAALAHSDIPRILSLDGGGVRGLLSLKILECLQKELDNVYHREGRVHIADFFEWIVGTSTGGIIAIALRRKIPISEIIRLYIDLSSTVFDRGVGARIAGLFRAPSGGFYNARKLESIIYEKLSGGNDWSDLRNVGITTRNCTDGISVLVTNDRQAPPPSKSTRAAPNMDIVEAVRLTSAAPGYFFPVRKTERELFGQGSEKRKEWVDGGVGANLPFEFFCSTNYLDAVSVLGENASADRQLIVISIGTGAHDSINDNVASDSLFYSHILRNLIDSAVDVANADKTCEKIMERRGTYIRLQPVLSQRIDLDDASAESIRLMTDSFSWEGSQFSNGITPSRVVNRIIPFLVS